MESLLQIMVAVIASVGASSGFWAYLAARDRKKSATSKMLKGLAHDRIVYLGMQYVHRGWISKNEYDDLLIRLYEPYKSLGGNGLAARVISQINELPFTQIDRGDHHEDQH